MVCHQCTAVAYVYIQWPTKLIKMHNIWTIKIGLTQLGAGLRVVRTTIHGYECITQPISHLG